PIQYAIDRFMNKYTRFSFDNVFVNPHNPSLTRFLPFTNRTIDSYRIEPSAMVSFVCKERGDSTDFLFHEPARLREGFNMIRRDWYAMVKGKDPAIAGRWFGGAEKNLTTNVSGMADVASRGWLDHLARTEEPFGAVKPYYKDGKLRGTFRPLAEYTIIGGGAETGFKNLFGLGFEIGKRTIYEPYRTILRKPLHISGKAAHGIGSFIKDSTPDGKWGKRLTFLISAAGANAGYYWISDATLEGDLAVAGSAFDKAKQAGIEYYGSNNGLTAVPGAAYTAGQTFLENGGTQATDIIFRSTAAFSLPGMAYWTSRAVWGGTAATMETLSSVYDNAKDAAGIRDLSTYDAWKEGHFTVITPGEHRGKEFSVKQYTSYDNPSYTSQDFTAGVFASPDSPESSAKNLRLADDGTIQLVLMLDGKLAVQAPIQDDPAAIFPILIHTSLRPGDLAKEGQPDSGVSLDDFIKEVNKTFRWELRNVDPLSDEWKETIKSISIKSGGGVYELSLNQPHDMGDGSIKVCAVDVSEL
ncbi:MAG: hypothetical protein KDD76_06860, partial [Rickettsiales bacterium]|nr:hypothetical protein [Rickettsiales bacterium]